MHDKLQLSIIIVLIFIGTGAIGLTLRSNQISEPSTQNGEVQGTPTLATSSPPEIVDTAKLYNLINGYRKERDLPELTVNPALEKSAQLKLQDMITEKYWRHEDSQNVQSWYLFTQAGYDYTVAGENLAFGLNTAWQVFDGWIESPRHNQELITTTYQDMGLAADCQTYIQEGKPSCVTVLHLGAN